VSNNVHRRTPGFQKRREKTLTSHFWVRSVEGAPEPGSFPSSQTSTPRPAMQWQALKTPGGPRSRAPCWSPASHKGEWFSPEHHPAPDPSKPRGGHGVREGRRSYRDHPRACASVATLGAAPRSRREREAYLNKSWCFLPGQRFNSPSQRTRRLPAEHGQPSPQSSLLVVHAFWVRPLRALPPMAGPKPGLSSGVGWAPSRKSVEVGGPEKLRRVPGWPQICLIENKIWQPLTSEGSARRWTVFRHLFFWLLPLGAL
jgi:hypothetical protein